MMQNVGNKLRALGWVKGFLLVVFAVHIIYGNRDEGTWPFMHWTMYSIGQPEQPEFIDYLYVRAFDEAYNQHIVHPRALLTVDDEIHWQPDGNRLVERSIVNTAPEHIEPLLRNLEAHIGAPVAEFGVWEQRYTIDYSAWPAYSLEFDWMKAQFTPPHIADARTPPSPPTEGDVIYRAGELFEVTEVFVGRTEVPNCQFTYVRTWWQAPATPAEDYDIWLTVANADGREYSRAGGPLARGATSAWEPNTPYMDAQSVQAPCDPGEYDLLLSLDGPNAPKMHTADGELLGEAVQLATLTVP